MTWELGVAYSAPAFFQIDILNNGTIAVTLELRDSTGGVSFYRQPQVAGTYRIPFSDFNGTANLNDVVSLGVSDWLQSSYGVTFDNLMLVIPSEFDADLDGVYDFEDSCLYSDLNPTLIINGFDTGVENILVKSGCTLADLIGDALSVGASQADLVALAQQWKSDGVISGRDFVTIVSTLASTQNP